MAFSISQTDPKTLSTESIYAELEAFTQLAVEVIERWSALMAELARRKQPVPMKNHPVMSFYKSIVDKTLSAEAALLLRNQGLIRCVLPLSRDEQLAIANDRLVPVAVQTEAGQIKSDARPLRLMDPATMKRAFGPDGIRTVHEQAEMIRAKGRVERVGAVTVLRDDHMVKIGNQKLKWPEDFADVARALGTEIIVTRDIVGNRKKERPGQKPHH